MIEEDSLAKTPSVRAQKFMNLLGGLGVLARVYPVIVTRVRVT
jgi:hypothetical protein